MKSINLLLGLLFLLLSSASYATQTVSESASRDQTDMEVTVYNSNLGLIKDRRKVRLPVGKGELRFMDVASRVNPVTVHVKSLNHPKGITVLEQNYEYDLMSSSKLLDKYVGKKIKGYL